jgi:hypothetical protein
MHVLNVTIEAYISDSELESLKKTATSLTDNVLILDNIILINRGIVIKDYVEYKDILICININYNTIMDVLEEMSKISTLLKRAKRITVEVK